MVRHRHQCDAPMIKSLPANWQGVIVFCELRFSEPLDSLLADKR